MALSRSVFVVLVLNVVFCYATIPVILWGELEGKSPKSNPLSSLTELEFEGILNRELQDDPILAVFVDETLSVEDFKMKNDEGETVFPYLHSNIGAAAYFPAVENPLEALHSIADPKKTQFYQITDYAVPPELESIENGIVFISFKDAKPEESRADLLQRHNNLMEDIVSMLQLKHDKVLAVYTARFPSWIVASHSRARRQAVDNTTSDYSLNGLRLYVSKLVMSSNGEDMDLTGLSGSHTTFNESLMNTELTFGDTSLTLNFAQKAGYWSFDSVHVRTNNIDQLLYGESEVYAFMGFSYRCAHNVTFVALNDTHHLSVLFRDIKIQPFFTSTNETQAFGESLNCVGFFSVPIWSGLLVTFVLLAITFYGIMMMMDIRTMDRFDDPKGKTITINAGE